VSLERDENLLHRTVEARRRNDAKELAISLRGMGTGSQPSLWGELKGLAMPALAVAGGMDNKYTRISSRMASINPRIKSAVFPGAGHTVHAETPAAYTSLLGRFVDGLSFALGEAKPVP
jgi:2-succinyl-6-hydroxy-2,4-cyclohexadiene-1-carboxylate synthase